ncbi:hypothetical protein [Flavobacterium gawalongense]|uniref:Uncharacterized protein n=1 Tax=Flavobacterium gawalongense TaxID=2594432 RepID=A0A553BH23_9FLAO|nr:hypothetical protein [Flavobacterium gawalongense]TRX07550.1 hypothetical protein FNW11_12800 [Flavobacterium gawalongense]TRX12951.1 hypothetical protein FNW10_02685 [Flavobacterium gawalongense]TRX31081.1 hypothetical protein FNW38_02565 [Flavobacterium gawalongense]
MKKNILFLLLLSMQIGHSQKLILDEKYEKNDYPVGFNFLPKSNKLIINRGQNYSLSTADNINSVYEYDSKGDKKTILENINLMSPIYSDTENTFNAAEYSKLRGKYQFKFYQENNVSSLYDAKTFNSFSSDQIIGKNFNDKYLIYLSNEKGKARLNLLENDVYLEIYEIFTDKKKRIKIDNFNKERLLKPDNIKYSEELGFSLKIIDNDYFEIITKSISKDYKSTVLYRTIYNFEGKLIKDISYQVSVKEDYLIYSNSDATYTTLNGRYSNPDDIKFGNNYVPATKGPAVGSDSNYLEFANDLAINNFIVDKDGNVYIYGLTGKKEKEVNDYNKTSGFYIFKYDKEGNKIWEYIKNNIDDPKHLNDDFPLSRLKSSLSINGNNVIFTVGTDHVNEFFHYAVVNMNDGKLFKYGKVVFTEKGVTMAKFYSFIPEFYKLPSNKKIVTNKNGLIVADYDVSIQNFINKLNDNVNIDVQFSVDGTWLIESDNETYYKVYYFKSE